MKYSFSFLIQKVGLSTIPAHNQENKVVGMTRNMQKLTHVDMDSVCGLAVKALDYSVRGCGFESHIPWFPFQQEKALI